MNPLSAPLRRRLSSLCGRGPFAGAARLAYRGAAGLLRTIRPLSASTAIVALTYRCQCSCGHCAVGLWKKDEKDELSRAEVLGLIKSFAELGVSEVHFFGGEPLLVAWLCECAEAASSKGLLTSLDTNGLLLDGQMIARLKKAGLSRLRVSIDSADAAEHDRRRRVDGLFAKAVEAVKECRKQGLECALSSCVSPESLAGGEAAAIIALAEKLGVKVRFLSAVRTGRWLSCGGAAFSRGDALAFRRLLSPERAYWETEFVCAPGSPFWCGAALKSHFSISAYGDVMPCSYLPLSFGNVRKEPLAGLVKKMWAADVLRGRKRHYDCPLNSPGFEERAERLRKSREP